ncbi:hypothetical protein MRB53_040554 [Persea americana]|nr:hypothetical protein MRB53_040554 [Persea americana]
MEEHADDGEASPRLSSADSEDGSEQIDSVLRAHITSLRLMISTWITHFRAIGWIKETTMEMLDTRVCRRCVELTVKDAKAR